MHGDKEVSTKQLARILGVKSVSLCDPKVANRHSGYLVGGTSPFGTKRAMPVYCEAEERGHIRIWELFARRRGGGVVACPHGSTFANRPGRYVLPREERGHIRI